FRCFDRPARTGTPRPRRRKLCWGHNSAQSVLIHPLSINAGAPGCLTVGRMLAAKAQYNLGNARKYFEEHLRVGDYYTEGQQVLGQWYGQGAEKLGLSGTTRGAEFLRLCENLHPQTGERLTLRNKTTRVEVGHLHHPSLTRSSTVK